MTKARRKPTRNQAAQSHQAIFSTAWTTSRTGVPVKSNGRYGTISLSSKATVSRMRKITRTIARASGYLLNSRCDITAPAAKRARTPTSGSCAVAITSDQSVIPGPRPRFPGSGIVGGWSDLPDLEIGHRLSPAASRQTIVTLSRYAIELSDIKQCKVDLLKPASRAPCAINPNARLGVTQPADPIHINSRLLTPPVSPSALPLWVRSHFV